MLKDNHIYKFICSLLERINLVKDRFNYEIKCHCLKKIMGKLQDPYVWKNLQQMKLLCKQRTYLEDIITSINDITDNLKNLIELLELSLIDNDQKLYIEIEMEANFLSKKLSKLEIQSMFSNKYDNYNCYIDIQSGSGGLDAQDWASMLFRMYLRWVNMKGFMSEIIEESEGEVVGIKSATVKVIGDYAYGWLRTETGIHRLVRKSPFDSNSRRHTSFSSVFVYPDIDDDINIKLNSADLRYDVYRSSGAGGQHVNKTESAVRIIHLPTNIITQCQSSRSQHKNKEQALKQLKSKLYNFELQKKMLAKKKLEDTKSNIGWGYQIRSYVLDDSRVKDLRTSMEVYDIKSVLDGSIDKFIEASIKLGL